MRQPSEREVGMFDMLISTPMAEIIILPSETEEPKSVSFFFSGSSSVPETTVVVVSGGGG